MRPNRGWVAAMQAIRVRGCVFYWSQAWRRCCPQPNGERACDGDRRPQSRPNRAPTSRQRFARKFVMRLRASLVGFDQSREHPWDTKRRKTIGVRRSAPKSPPALRGSDQPRRGSRANARNMRALPGSEPIAAKPPSSALLHGRRYPAPGQGPRPHRAQIEESPGARPPGSLAFIVLPMVPPVVVPMVVRSTIIGVGTGPVDVARAVIAIARTIVAIA